MMNTIPNTPEKKTKKRVLKKATWLEFYEVISEMMPEFKFDRFDKHINGNYEARCRFLNKYKLEQIQAFAKTCKDKDKVSAGDLFILKLDLAKKIYDYDNRGKKTMQEAIDYIKNRA